MSQNFTTLVDVETLAQYVDAPDWRIIDCRFDLLDKAAGRRQYHEAHIPNALYAHLEHDLSGQQTAMTGRHPLPGVDELAKRFAAWGIGPATQLVVYDAQSGAVASRLWWLSRWLGHDRVAVLNGGFAAWTAGRYPLDTAVPDISAVEFIPDPKDDLWVSTATLQSRLHNAGILLIDAREAVRFRGEEEPLDKVAGHIPGSINLPFATCLDHDGRFLTHRELQRHILQKVTNIPAECIVHSCGSGVTACLNILAMEIIGLSGSRLYPGSWSEWIIDPNRAVVVQKVS